MRTNENDEKSTIVLTPERQQLLEFFEQSEIPDLLKCFNRVFEIASFFSVIELQNFDTTALYTQYELIQILEKLKANS